LKVFVADVWRLRTTLPADSRNYGCYCTISLRTRQPGGTAVNASTLARWMAGDRYRRILCQCDTVYGVGIRPSGNNYDSTAKGRTMQILATENRVGRLCDESRTCFSRVDPHGSSMLYLVTTCNMKFDIPQIR
jgi:hypothetical protein